MNPSLYQINTRAFLYSISPKATLLDVPDSFLDGLKSQGFEWVWFLGVWQTGILGPAVSRSHSGLRHEYSLALPNVADDDICGSPFAVFDYSVHADLGGNDALAALRSRLHERGIRLLLDFVPNHLALDHAWVQKYPALFVTGTPELCSKSPENWYRVNDDVTIAYGRDPYFSGWTDTAQLNYAHQDVHDAMAAELLRVSELCDGLRCDMAMLLLPEVFRGTWGAYITMPEVLPCFWSVAIAKIKERYPHFIFMAEVYWGLESELLRRGFDYTYDKVLYDRLVDLDAVGITDHLRASLEYQKRCVRFLENHDEPRIASRLSADQEAAASAIAFLSPGLRFFHQGQFEGNRVRIPVQLRRGPKEVVQDAIVKIYKLLVPIITSPLGRDGAWQLLPCAQAWEANPTNQNFVCFLLRHDEEILLVCVNYSKNRGQCYVKIPDYTPLLGRVRLEDLLSPNTYERDAAELLQTGLYLDIPEWRTHVFRISCRSPELTISH